MTKFFASIFCAVLILSIPALSQSVANYPGAGVMQAGDAWESFLPQGYGPNSTEATTAATLGVRRFIQMGNFDRNWSTPATHWPAAFYMTPYWLKDNWVTVYDPDTTWNRGPSTSNPSFFIGSRAYPGANYSNHAQLTYKSTLNGASDPARHYSVEPYFVDGTLRQHVVYEAAWPTQLGVDVKMRAHGFAAPNWNNLNDYVIVEIELKNTGYLDINMDGVPEQINHDVEALAFMIEEQAYMSISSYGGGGRNVNDIVPAIIARQAGFVNDLDSTGSPWAFSTVFPSATTYNPAPGSGNTDLGFNGGMTKNYMDIHHGWVMLDVKAGGLPSDRSLGTSTLPSKLTLFGTHPVGQGAQRGWYMSGGSSYWAGPSSDPMKVFYVSTGVWYQNGGQLSHNTDFTQLNLAPNTNFFASGTAGNPLTFVPKASPTKPNGDFKSTNTFDQVSFEDGKADATTNYPTGWGKWSEGCSHTENFDDDMFSGVGPFSLNSGETITIVYATVAGYRLEGIQRSVRAVRWAYEQNFGIPHPPPVPDMLVTKLPIGYVTIEWDNRAEADGEFAGYKIWRASKADTLNFLDEGMRVVDRYQEQMTPGPRPTSVYKPVNPKFDAFAKTLAASTHGTYTPDTWGTWTLEKTILKNELGSLASATSPGYRYKWIDSTSRIDFTGWYYVSAFKEGSYTGPGGEVSNRIETHSTNRNGATGLWNLTFPFGFLNANFPEDPAGLKDIGAGVLIQSPVTAHRLNFGTVNFGSSQTLDVRIVNSADDSLRVNLTSDQGSFVPIPSSLVISPGSDTIVVIKFTPSRPGLDSALVVVTTNGRPQVDTIAVYGSGGSGTRRATIAWDRFPSITTDIVSGAYVAWNPSGAITAAQIDNSTTPTMVRLITYDSVGTTLWSARDTILTTLPAIAGLHGNPDGSIYTVTNGSPNYEGLKFNTAKYSASGERIWRRLYAPFTMQQVAVTGTAVDRTQNIYVTGHAQRYPGNNYQIVTLKYDSSGTMQWNAVFDGPVIGGDSTDYANAIAVDSAGNVYVAGTTGPWSSSNIVVVKCNQVGIQQWVQYYNGPSDSTDAASDIAVDPSGDVYVVGRSNGPGTGNDITVLKLRGSDGTLQWIDRYDGSGHGDDQAIACIFTGEALYVSGSVSAEHSLSNAILLKYGSSGSRSVLLQYSGTTGIAYGGGLCEDQMGFLYFGGRCFGALGNDESYAFKLDKSAGITWEAHYSVNSAIPTFPVDLVPIGNGGLAISGYFGTTGFYRYFVAKIGEIPSSVPGDIGTLPVLAQLYQNYPNPFNPSTSIRYGLPRQSHVSLTVFNILGQRVAQLVEGEVEPGYHDVKFDAASLSSGVYFCRLQADGFVQTRKLLLLK